MRLRSIGILSVLGLLGLVLATQTTLAQGMTPGQAAPPLPTLDLTKPGSPRPSAITPPQAGAPVQAPQASPKAPPAAAPQASSKVPPSGAKAKATAAKTTTPSKKTTTKAPPKAAKAKPSAKPTQTATAGDR
jgi:hypothetical protein